RTWLSAGASNPHTPTLTGGADVAGALDAAPGGDGFAVLGAVYTELLNGELVNSQSKKVDANGALSWTFQWTAPTVSTNPGVMMYAAGLSVNLNGSTS